LRFSRGVQQRGRVPERLRAGKSKKIGTSEKAAFLFVSRGFFVSKFSA
jgi:hypothetical protein